VPCRVRGVQLVADAAATAVGLLPALATQTMDRVASLAAALALSHLRFLLRVLHHKALSQSIVQKPQTIFKQKWRVHLVPSRGLRKVGAFKASAE